MDLEEEIRKIKERNSRVETDKAWETSQTRIIFLSVITYVLVTLVLCVIHNERPFVYSLIPTLGYFISMQSLPFIKKWWVKRRSN